MFHLFVLAAVLVAVSAQTPPQISDDFTAEVKLDMTNGHRERHVEGKWYFDFTGKRDRFVFHFNLSFSLTHSSDSTLKS